MVRRTAQVRPAAPEARQAPGHSHFDFDLIAMALDDGPELKVQAEWQLRKVALVDYVDAIRADLHWDTRGKIRDLLALVADLVRCLPGSEDPGRPAAEAELDKMLDQVAALRGRLLA